MVLCLLYASIVSVSVCAMGEDLNRLTQQEIQNIDQHAGCHDGMSVENTTITCCDVSACSMSACYMAACMLQMVNSSDSHTINASGMRLHSLTFKQFYVSPLLDLTYKPPIAV